MARRADLINFHDQAILVTIRIDFFHMLDMSAGFALAPKLLTGTGPETGAPALLHPLMIAATRAETSCEKTAAR